MRSRHAPFWIAALGAALSGAPAHADDCVRGVPTPAFSAQRMPIRDHRFDLRSDQEAIERFRFGPGTRVELRHGGCEYVVASFRFASADLLKAGQGAADAYRAAAALLLALDRLHPATGFRLQLAAAALLREVRRTPQPQLDKALPVAGDGVPPLEAVVTIDAAGRKDGQGRIALSLSRGPL
jgi:hypothetical protein